jgi:hypothetical protein
MQNAKPQIRGDFCIISFLESNLVIILTVMNVLPTFLPQKNDNLGNILIEVTLREKDFFFFFMVLGFELRAWCLPGRYSTNA